MRSKTKIVILAIIVASISAIPLRVQYRHIMEANAQHARLVQKTTSLQAAVDRLEAALQNPQDGQLRAQALSRMLDDGGDFIPVSKETLKNVGWQALDYDTKSRESNFTLTGQAIGLLSLTPEETTQVQEILMELKERIQAYQRSAIHETTVEQLHTSNPYNENFLTVHRDKDLFDLSEVAGTLTFYEILPMDNNQRKVLRQWISDSLFGAIGADRAEVLVSNLRMRPFNIAYDDQEDEESMLFAFWDHAKVDGQETETEWEVYNGSIRTGVSAEAVPPQWAYLFQEVPDDPSVRRKIAR